MRKNGIRNGIENGIENGIREKAFDATDGGIHSARPPDGEPLTRSDTHSVSEDCLCLKANQIAFGYHLKL